MNRSRILISGAGIAGLTLAYWLNRYGFQVTVVEQAQALRAGGQAVDLKGPVQMSILRKMGIFSAVRDADVRDADVAIVNASGRRVGRIPGALGAGDVNIPRGDLVAILYERTKRDCEYLFDDSIATLAEMPHGVDVTFRAGEPRTFDLVVGADGMHSTVRRLVFGPERDYVSHLGAYYVLADLDVGPEIVSYSQPGLMVTLGATKAPAFLAFASPVLPSARGDVDLQKRQTATALRNGRWRIPELVAQLPGATGFFMDSVSRAVVGNWSHGRIVLVGDSAWGNTLGGYGTGLALVGAYVLAGELAQAGGDHAVAFAAYQENCRDHVRVSQKVNAARLLVPRTWSGIYARNLLFTVLGLAEPLLKLLDRPASGITLENYDPWAKPTDPQGDDPCPA
ncbi:FAD-dependent monooxygenase [Kineosporia mesophila]|uniref:FAD-dependent monooxygenase n=1 Tax=Kineosporia mesophila TaxID=566012 RepID=A0ABP7ALH1_9ACTN|nr:FAD-dependent monooxygenase [Kineosporia mesophila]MCD5354008.1 FAD-dependent monooxygenase [Kineosporia mesophila]